MSHTINPLRRPDVETYVLPDGTALLFDPLTEAGHPLDILGALAWDYCDGTMSGSEIAQEIAGLIPQVTGVADQTIAVLRDFVERGLLAPSAEGDSTA